MESMIADLESNHQRKKRRKIEDDHNNDGNQQLKRRWRTRREQQIYSQKLLEALRRTRRGTLRGREIKETADRVLATSAKGTTRWSRAILTSRIGRLRLKKRRRTRVTGQRRLKRKEEFAGVKRKLPGAERKVKVLGRLVPGCRKLSFTSLLDEASDYIAALEMQVRAMTTLTQILSGAPTSPLLQADGEATTRYERC
ncbi:putative Basic helix-loop-helix DNA-binding superfamily protein [Tripterygium wilfordii]|uniref:Putative Basic helix-loop-helix DNA-binding superfamily protein n=1 Tax=Tripterygium wilfordii TaxID=458696 RepID=A0A7J7DK05_TRIWF|nr:transcription factor bHLH149-like [Tripterygium wilfordii]KAF5746700.1 putative Basic helix-loop-helix DNA-binding superfamily protein [Tripterygium wilfordii]